MWCACTAIIKKTLRTEVLVPLGRPAQRRVRVLGGVDGGAEVEEVEEGALGGGEGGGAEGGPAEAEGRGGEAEAGDGDGGVREALGGERERGEQRQLPDGGGKRKASPLWDGLRRAPETRARLQSAQATLGGA